MSFLPKDFVVPTLLETERFRLRPLTVHDVIKDYDAVMSSREHLWSMFGAVWGWPAADLTLEQDLIDLGWHHKEFQGRSSFAYTVVSLDEARVLGCVYVDAARHPQYDATVCLWVRQDELANGLDEALLATVKEWIATAWPFQRAAYPGREIAWAKFNTYDPVADVLATEKAWSEAHRSGDFATIAHLMADDYVRINPDGSLSNRAETLASYQPEERHWDLAQGDQYDVRINGDSAVVIGRWTARGVNNDQDFDYQARFLSVYQRRNGHWQMVAEQSTTIA